MAVNLAVTLIDTYRTMETAEEAGKGFVEFDMTKTKKRSPTMRMAKAV